MSTPMATDDLSQALAREALRQQALMTAIHGTPQPDDSPGLRAHRGHQRVVAGQLLNSVYPRVALMVGEDTLAQLAWQLWRQHPPTSGDLGDWGSTLPELLTDLVAHDADWQPWACLPDLARLEWACHQCERSAEVVPDLSSLSLLGTAEPHEITIDLQTALRIEPSGWPLAEMWPSLTEARADEGRLHALLKQPQTPASSVVVSRLPGGNAGGTSPWLARLTPLPEGMVGWMQALTSADAPSLQVLLERQPPGFDFTAWLTLALQEGWIWRVRGLRSPAA
jgi:Putative DNA-binding domain